jgi:yecA family protein
MSSLSRRYRLAPAAADDCMPPNLAAMGEVPFGSRERARLHAWLREAGWPRDHMDIAEVEGYLVALIAWPVDIPSGAWLPPIWGERGWKLPAKIATRSKYEEFVALIVGFMQSLDRESRSAPSRFESLVLHEAHEREQARAVRSWGKGFMKALTLGSQGLKWRNAGARAAVRTIASSTSAVPVPAGAAADIASAVSSLIGQRGSRGPLGPLDVMRRSGSAAGEA